MKLIYDIFPKNRRNLIYKNQDYLFLEILKNLL